MSEGDLRILLARAKRLHRRNVSAVVHEMVESLRRADAMDELVATLGGEHVTEAEMQEIRDEVAAPPKRSRKARPAA